MEAAEVAAIAVVAECENRERGNELSRGLTARSFGRRESETISGHRWRLSTYRDVDASVPRTLRP